MIKLFPLFKIVFCLVFACTLFIACKHNKKTQKAVAVVSAIPSDSINAKCKLDYKTSRALSRHVKENEFDFNWLTAKANVESNIDGKEESLDIKLSIKKDSAMLISIRYILGLEVAKLLITKDSVKFVNDIGKNYFKGDFIYINELLSADIDFELLQAVLFGNSADFSDEETKLKPITDRKNCRYLLSTERKRKFKKIQNGAEIKSAMQTLTLNPDNFKILSNEFVDPLANRSFVANYSKFTSKDSVFAPYHVDIDIVAQKKASLKIDYVRIEKNSPQKLSINIPAKYDNVQIQKK